MKKNRWKARKVVVVGTGAVGSTFAYAMAIDGTADTIALIDRNESHAKGQVMDLVHGVPFFPAVDIKIGDKSDYADAQIIVIAAGASQKPGETRLELLQKNAGIIENIIGDIAGSGSEAVVIIVSNPVDVLTYVALKKSGWPAGRIIGSGTVLDSSRFRYLLSRRFSVDAHNVHAYILGEHGDSEFAAWSLTSIAGRKLDKNNPMTGIFPDWPGEKMKIEDEVRNSAYHIIDYKGATYYAVGLAMVRIAKAILRNQKSILTVSTLLDGQYGLSDVCLSVPCILGNSGVGGMIEGGLSEQEMKSLEKSAGLLKKSISELE